MDFQFIHIYPNMHTEANVIAGGIARIFPGCKVDVRRSFKHDYRIERARISDMKQPFEMQPEPKTDDMVPLYDGFVLQGIFAGMIPAAEANHIHIIITNLLTCTFSEEDWRYHGRAVICGSPSIISTTGIVEAPAKPRGFYLAQQGNLAEVGNLKKRFAGRFIDYGEGRVTAAATVYVLQALFFFITSGEPFCRNKKCSLYNAHWQEELIEIVEKGRLCSRHSQMANKFNKGSARR
ncbi:MAG TPA: DUF6775 family putative metallopeptidase [Nitrososphaera sp.]|nr:DUF6775 family putative metallopeptidase [Nitrososphaera sp.]